MSDLTLVGQRRNEFGKGAARRARRAGLVPAVIYGRGTEPVHLDVDAHELFMIVRSTSNALVTLSLEGEKYLVLIKDVQRHPVSRAILHADLQSVRADEKVDVDVNIEVIGESAVGTVHSIEEFTLNVKAPANAIPDHIEVDITGLENGSVVRVRDLKLADGIDIQLDEDTEILHIEFPKEQEEEPAATAEESTETAAEEPAENA